MKEGKMTDKIYRKLAIHLDNLPGGFPTTESGVELRILRRLFTPEQAALALHLTLISEEPRVVARRARIDIAEATDRLEKMAKQGLILRMEPEDTGKPFQLENFAILAPKFIRHLTDDKLFWFFINMSG